MSLSNSSKIDDQIDMTFLSVMNEAMSILKADEVVAAAASSSTRRSKRRVNSDRETFVIE
jgi:hypothetical protein